MNLFDIEHDMQVRIEGPRNARQPTEDELRAYADFVMRSRGICPKSNTTRLQFATSGYRAQQRRWLAGVTIGPRRTTGEGYTRRETWDYGAYSVLVPGYNHHRDKVTMDTLNDAGEVETSLTMPLEPKKGGIVWTAKQVRDAVGKVAKPKRAKASRNTYASERKKRKRLVKLALRLRQRAAHADTVAARRFRDIRTAESVAMDHLDKRNTMQTALRDAERRAEIAEAENAQLWAELEELTRPVAA